jgi:Domain of unknown function (DUF4252)
MRVQWMAAGLLGAALLSACATAQPGSLDIPNYAHLSRKAADSTTLSLSGPLLRMAARLSDAKNDPDPALQLLAQLSSVQVRSFEFAADDAYTTADVEVIRKQLQGPGWSQIVKVRNPRSREQVDIYINLEKGEPRGLAIISAEPRELTIVNIVGSIDIQQLAKVQEQLGIPKLALQQ